jgi:hypothetical protein
MTDEQTHNLITLSQSVKVGFRNEQEREFLTALYSCFSEWGQFGLTDDDSFVSFYDDSILMVAFDICDRKQSTVLRSLRIDFTGTSVLVCDLGNGSSNLFDSRLFDTDLDVKEYRVIGDSPSDLAALAAQWVTQEFTR